MWESTGHEYALECLTFASLLELDNPKLDQKWRWVMQQRQEKRITVRQGGSLTAPSATQAPHRVPHHLSYMAGAIGEGGPAGDVLAPWWGCCLQRGSEQLPPSSFPCSAPPRWGRSRPTTPSCGPIGQSCRQRWGCGKARGSTPMPSEPVSSRRCGGARTSTKPLSHPLSGPPFHGPGASLAQGTQDSVVCFAVNLPLGVQCLQGCVGRVDTPMWAPHK